LESSYNLGNLLKFKLYKPNISLFLTQKLVPRRFRYQSIPNTKVSPKEIQTGVSPKEVQTGVSPKEVWIGVSPKEVWIGVSPKEVQTGVSPKEVQISVYS